MIKDEFYLELSKLGINLNDIQKEQLDKYYRLLLEWNNKINLTRILDEKDVYLKHFYDSITLFRVVNLNDNLSICDIGTGAGFPGIVLKIVFPNLKIVLVDALEKRIKFLNIVIDELNLKNIVAIHERGEIYAKKHREEFDVVTSRAVARMEILLEICIPLVKVNGLFVAMKANLTDEIDSSKEILRKIDSELIKIDEFNLPFENSIRNLVVIEKCKKTKQIYPREFSKMKKEQKSC